MEKQDEKPTFTYSCIIIIVIFISIPTLTSVWKSPLDILSVIRSHITLSVVILIIVAPIT